MEPQGFLPFTVEPQPGDRLVLYPVYLCPVGMLERGLFVRPAYLRCIVVVNAFNSQIELTDSDTVWVNDTFDLSSFETRRLEVKISPELAARIAETGAASDGRGGWRGVAHNRRADCSASEVRLVWHVYAVRGNEAIDTFTGKAVPAEAMVALLFN